MEESTAETVQMEVKKKNMEVKKKKIQQGTRWKKLSKFGSG